MRRVGNGAPLFACGLMDGARYVVRGASSIWDDGRVTSLSDSWIIGFQGGSISFRIANWLAIPRHEERITETSHISSRIMRTKIESEIQV